MKLSPPAFTLDIGIRAEPNMSLMSAWGQKQTSAQDRLMSALPSKADVPGATGMSAFCQKRRATFFL